MADVITSLIAAGGTLTTALAGSLVQQGRATRLRSSISGNLELTQKLRAQGDAYEQAAIELEKLVSEQVTALCHRERRSTKQRDWSAAFGALAFSTPFVVGVILTWDQSSWLAVAIFWISSVVLVVCALVVVNGFVETSDGAERQARRAEKVEKKAARKSARTSATDSGRPPRTAP